ncbi:MAG: tetratricopeptide repeat protein [Prevotellaceae bacterium]|jgi:tetratricopeptide (TPR) repeat protein|nr:tetratricopeptide repeat protein [Prevotellaceae bacterium]
MSKSFFTVLVTFIFAGTVYSQNVEKKFNELYQKGVDLFEKGLYTDAEMVFLRASKETDPADRLTLSEIAYYRAMCAIELHLPNLETYVEDLRGNHSENKNINRVTFQLANYYFQEQDYRKALQWYEEVDSRALRYYEHVECVFKKGYAYFETGEIDLANKCFIEIKDVPDSPYSVPATYYYGHTEYLKQHYISAQLAFEKISTDDRFAAQALFYLLNIYYSQQDYEEVIKTGEKLLPTMSEPYHSEMARIIAESCYHIGNYDKAREYFAIYSPQKTNLSRTDEYFLGLLEYHAANYTEAARYFNQVSRAQQDSLAQNSYYYLGSIYLTIDKKADSQKAFYAASQQSFLPALTKDAFFQYAKLSLELQNSGEPMKQYLEKYPDEDANPEIKGYLAALHIIKNDYRQALEQLSLIPKPSDKEQSDIQRLNFIIGKQLYDEQDSSKYEEALNYLEASLRVARYDATVEALAKYYKADIYYLLGLYKEAQKQFEAFVSGSGAMQSRNEYIAAHYNLAYCYYRQDDYDNALSWFRKFIAAAGQSFRMQVADSYNRIGDCHYIQSKYWPAAENYTAAADMDAANPDYALYQKALSYGLLSRHERKIETLQELLKKYTHSEYAPAGLLELGRTYFQYTRYNEAETAFKQLLADYPGSPQIVHALIELGLLCTNTNRMDEAVEYYTKAQQKAVPNSVDEKSALEGLQNAYLDKGTPNLYFQYLESIGKESNTAERALSLYSAAEKSANSGSCDKAIPEFKVFIANYPNNANILPAHYYLATCYYERRNYMEAVSEFKYVINDADNNIYKEQSLIKSGQANIFLEDYPAAVENLKQLSQLTENASVQLSAHIDMAKIHFEKLRNYREAANIAHAALLMPAISEPQAREMTSIKANSWRILGQEEEALQLYRELAAKKINDRENAEANFYLIAATFKQGKFEEGEAMAVKFINSEANIYQYWTAMTLVTLAEQYALKGNITQAEATYDSILKGYKNTDDGIIETVKQRMEALKK